MEVKLSVSSSRRISFASDLAYDEDLEIEELENRRDHPSRYPNRNRVFSYSYYDYSDDDEDDKEENDDENKEDYVNIACNKLFKDLSNEIIYDGSAFVEDFVQSINIFFWENKQDEKIEHDENVSTHFRIK